LKYKASERQWVVRLLARLNPDQRRRYEEACRVCPIRGAHSGKLYDGEKAKIAERILYEDAKRGESQR
jgi:hypothetical protein